ncbi:MAG: ABC transporter permease subunit [Nitrospiraceae bacterium]|nr:ABC transporter permease subunit [Nitrospiraceae bacterium]
MISAQARHRCRVQLQGYLFIAPWLLGFFAFVAGPMLFSVLLGFYQWNGITPFDASHASFVGLDNYGRMFRHDPLFWKSLWNTLYYAGFSVPLGICVSLLLAVLLNVKVRGIAFFRTAYYIPHVVGGVATIMMWSWVFNPDFGGLNLILHKTGIVALGQWAIDTVPGVKTFLDNHNIAWPPLWLADAFWAKPAIIIMSIWGAGAGMLIYLAGLNAIPKHLYEVAEIDGAGRVRQFFAITIPMLTPTIFFHLVMNIIGSFQVFSQAYLMTGGGPDNATLFYVLYLYQKAFQHFEMGYASALAWVLFAIIMMLTLLVIRSSRLWVYYEGEKN